MIHVFERAGLGKAPFYFDHYFESKFCALPGAPVLPGSSCDFCGTAIMACFMIRSSDGNRFKVGCDCVAKTDDAGLIDVVKRAANRIKLQARHQREKERIMAIEAQLETPEIKALLDAQPHPSGWAGRTLLDWAFWMMDHAGSKGRLEVGRVILAAKSGG